MERLTFGGNFCDIAQCRDLQCKYDGNCTQKEVWERLKAYEDSRLSPQACAQAAEIEKQLASYDFSAKKMLEFIKADKDGRIFIMPVAPGVDMIDQIFPDSPRIMKNVRPAISYISRGTIYSMSLRTFAGGIENGSIAPVSAETERALLGLPREEDADGTDDKPE